MWRTTGIVLNGLSLTASNRWSYCLEVGCGKLACCEMSQRFLDVTNFFLPQPKEHYIYIPYMVGNFVTIERLSASQEGLPPTPMMIVILNDYMHRSFSCIHSNY
jgi:hypothetical protein